MNIMNNKTQTTRATNDSKHEFHLRMQFFRSELRSAALRGDILEFSRLMKQNKNLSNCLQETVNPW
jgi:hypothetical protein